MRRAGNETSNENSYIGSKERRPGPPRRRPWPGRGATTSPGLEVDRRRIVQACRGTGRSAVAKAAGLVKIGDLHHLTPRVAHQPVFEALQHRQERGSLADGWHSTSWLHSQTPSSEQGSEGPP